MTNEAVKISVLVTTYNLESYIGRTLDSVVSQVYDGSFEVLVGDDGSGDGTVDVIREYMEKHPGLIKLFIREREELLTARLMEGMSKLPYIKIYGSKDPKKHCGIVTFTMDGVHPHDVSSVLNEDRICVRAGHHCAQPLMQFLGVGSTARASVYFYNTEDEVDRFIDRLSAIRGVMGYGA